MPQQSPDINNKANIAVDGYVRRLFVATAFGYTEIARSRFTDKAELLNAEGARIARIVNDYAPPTPAMKTSEIKIINAPSKIHSSGKSSYEISLRLLFPDKVSYNNFMFNLSGTFKYYDERGSIFMCVVADRPSAKMICKVYDVTLKLMGTRKEDDDSLTKMQFTDLDSGVGTKVTFTQAPVNGGNVTVHTPIGDYVVNFPDAFIVNFTLEGCAYHFRYELLAKGFGDYYSVTWYEGSDYVNIYPKSQENSTITVDFSSSDVAGTLTPIVSEHWAKQYVEDLARCGMISTIDADSNYIYTFRPEDLATRAEMAVFFNNLRKYVERKVVG